MLQKFSSAGNVVVDPYIETFSAKKCTFLPEYVLLMGCDIEASCAALVEEAVKSRGHDSS